MLQGRSGGLQVGQAGDAPKRRPRGRRRQARSSHDRQQKVQPVHSLDRQQGEADHGQTLSALAS